MIQGLRKAILTPLEIELEAEKLEALIILGMSQGSGKYFCRVGIGHPLLSSSSSPLICGTQQCSSLDVSKCHNNACLYEVCYGDGSYTARDFVTETITFDYLASVNKVAIGCGHNNKGLFCQSRRFNRLRRRCIYFPSQINVSSFSYCLVNHDFDLAWTPKFDSSICLM